MEFKTTKILIKNDSLEFKTTAQSSSFVAKTERYKLGILYKIEERQQIEFGIRSERQKFSYHGYKNIELTFTNQGIQFDSAILELLTDSIFWVEEEVQQIGSAYIAFRYTIDL